MEAVLTREAAATSVADAATRESRLLQRSSELLGGGKLFKVALNSRFDVHKAIVAGAFPYASLLFFITAFKTLDEEDIVNVLGISGRTLRRQRETPRKPMPAVLASKTWLFAETLAKAADVFGSREKAEEWLNKPAMGLDGQRPIEMLQTVQGTELVNNFLARLEYGIYS
jgi:putative toxin-antitoxin system antitoxin component (TIGR02293 family)